MPSPWLSRLATLKAARTAARGTAPHKPLMLLTVIDLIESGVDPLSSVHAPPGKGGGPATIPIFPLTASISSAG